MIRILIADDEERIRTSTAKALAPMGYTVDTASDGADALRRIENEYYDVLITDLVMPEMDGIEVLHRAKELRPALPVIVLTGHGTVETAVTAMKEGAFDYITKPYNIDEIDVVLQRAVEHSRILVENIDLRRQVESRSGFSNIIGESEPMQKIYRVVERIRNTSSTVLITGESGTGKELIARAIHFTGTLAARPFITVDCGAITETLLESELFGHVRGSFTGAHKDKTGYFEAADGGSIFLDEVGEFSPALQTRLLRVLQEGAFTRVGDHKERKVDVRVITATNRDLELAVSQGIFREDLYYRINVITINVPPLRERAEDIPSLVNHFLQKFNRKLEKNILRISDDALALLAAYSWPGNVRELENVLERVVTFCDGEVIDADCLPENILDIARRAAGGAGVSPMLLNHTYRDAKNKVVQDFNRKYLEGILDACDGNIAAASRRAGMDRGCFYRLIKKYGIRSDEHQEDVDSSGSSTPESS